MSFRAFGAIFPISVPLAIWIPESSDPLPIIDAFRLLIADSPQPYLMIWYSRGWVRTKSMTFRGAAAGFPAMRFRAQAKPRPPRLAMYRSGDARLDIASLLQPQRTWRHRAAPPSGAAHAAATQ